MRAKKFNSKAVGMMEAEREGWFVHDVERHLGSMPPRSFITVDFLGNGGGDFICWRKHPTIPGATEWLLVNGTTEKHLKQHIEDAQANKRLKREWLDLGLRYEIWAYPDLEQREAGEAGCRRVAIGPNAGAVAVSSRAGKPGSSD